MAKITRIKATDPHEPKEKPVKKAAPKAEKAEKPEKPAKAEKPKKPQGKFRRFITAPFRYIHSSWLELRQVRWPSRKSTWAMVLAVLVYTAIFIGFIVLIDALFTLIFNNILG
ncbi:preprotein translocase subunit SecE [Candidatus Saccharibacteria bacterium]|nr:preprotein translocase subunit SecE [Candidatus Saccharibacteria bacterium]